MINFLESGGQNLRFSVLTADLTYSFSTQTSISFTVKVGSFHGWIDVHFPCKDHIKTHIRGALPDEYLEASNLRQFISAFLCEIEFPNGETYEATFFKATKIIEMVNAVNREGFTDRIETEKRYIAPD